MSDEGRRVFKMETVLELVAGRDSNDVLDMMSYLAKREVCSECFPLLAPLARGYLYSLSPGLFKSEYLDGDFAGWAKSEISRLGANISVPPLPDKELAAVNNTLDILDEANATADEKIAEAANLAKQVKDLAPFKAKAEDAAKKLEAAEAKNADLTKKTTDLSAQITDLKKELDAFKGKLAIDEADLGKAVKDIVTKAVKDSLGALAVAGAIAGAAEETPAEEKSEDPAQDAVPDSFGFGTSGANSDGFGF